MSAILLLIAALAVVNVEGDGRCKLDLIFLDDGSSSICENNPKCPNWKANLEFIKNIIRSLTIGPDATKVAYLKYGVQTDLRWNLNKYTEKQSLLDAIDGESIPGGELSSIDSFKVVVTDVFTAAGGDRPEVPNVAILITDNANVTALQAATASTDLQVAANLKMMMVCLNTTTSRCHEPCAAAVSSAPHERGVTYFMAPKYSLIESVRKVLQEHLCDFPIAD